MAKHLNALDHLLACLVPYATSPRAQGVLEAHKLSVANVKRCVSKGGSKKSKAREWLDDRPFARRIRAVLAKARLKELKADEGSSDRNESLVRSPQIRVRPCVHAPRLLSHTTSLGISRTRTPYAPTHPPSLPHSTHIAPSLPSCRSPPRRLLRTPTSSCSA